MAQDLSASLRGVAPANYKAQDDYIVTLQNLLATESAEKEVAQISLYSWKKAVDGHRRQLLALIQDGVDRNGENVWRRIQDEVKKFEESVGKLQKGGNPQRREEAGVGTSSPRRTYDVLRASLNETQRRCESLNNDMLAQQEANQQLVQSLNTSKDNNKELLRQIQNQTSEITRLTQERIADEQKMDVLQRQHRQEEDLWKQDGYRRLQVLRDQGDERYSTTYNHLSSKCNFVKARAGVLKQEFENIKSQTADHRAQVLNLKEQICSAFQQTEKRVLTEMENKERIHVAAREKLKDKIKDLELKLVEEHEFHGHEVSSWSHRYVSAQAEREDMQARMDRELSMLASQKQGLTRSVKAEKSLYQQEIAKLDASIGESTKSKGDLEKQLDDAKREVFRLQSVYGSIETEAQCKESVVADLRKQLREADDALSAAVAGNEHLRCQMEEQRLRFADMNEAELSRLKNSFEEKLQKLREQQQNESQLLEFQIKSLDEVLGEKNQQHERLMKMMESLQNECGVLERDVAIWKSTFDQAVRNRHDLEREYAQCRQEWARQKLTVIETTETNESKRGTLETELKFLTDSFVEQKRTAASRETELASRIHAFEDVLKTTKAHSAEAQASLTDVVEAINKTKSEASLQLQISTETCCQLERDLEQKKSEWEDERRRLDICLENERRDASDSREKYERWREHHALALKQVSDENSAKMTALESDRQAKQEAFSAEEHALQLELQQNNAKVEHLKAEAARLRHSVQDSNNKFTTIRHEVEREEREMNFQHSQYYEELKQLAAQVEESKRNEATISKHLESTNLRASIENKRLLKELNETTDVGGSTLAEAEKKLNIFKQSYAETLEDTSFKYNAELNRDLEKMESVNRENAQLKSFLGDINRSGQPALFPAQSP